MSFIEKLFAPDTSPEYVFKSVIPICPHLTFQGDKCNHKLIAEYIEKNRKPDQRIIFPILETMAPRTGNLVPREKNAYRIYCALRNTSIPDSMITVLSISYMMNGRCIEPIGPNDIVIWNNRLNFMASIQPDTSLPAFDYLMNNIATIYFTPDTTNIFTQIFQELGVFYRKYIQQIITHKSTFAAAIKTILHEYMSWCEIVMKLRGFDMWHDGFDWVTIDALVDSFILCLFNVHDITSLKVAMASELRLIYYCRGVMDNALMFFSYRQYINQGCIPLSREDILALAGEVMDTVRSPDSLSISMDVPELNVEENPYAELIEGINQEYIADWLSEYLPYTLHSRDIVLKLPEERIAMILQEYRDSAVMITAVPLTSSKVFRLYHVYVEQDTPYLLFMLRGYDHAVYGISLDMKKPIELIQLRGDPRYKYEYSY